jgi:hypothetical protein
MLKKLISMLVVTSLAFGVDVSKNNGLCFDPYNHDYEISTDYLGSDFFTSYNEKVSSNNVKLKSVTEMLNYAMKGVLNEHHVKDEEIVLHNGKMENGIELVKYVVKGDKALVLMKRDGYLVVYVRCVNGVPQTKYWRIVGSVKVTDSQAFDFPKYPIKLGFYKGGFYTAALVLSTTIWKGCAYVTEYYPDSSLSKVEYLPTRECNALIEQALKLPKQ